MIPKRLYIKNFLSHDESQIDFDRFNFALILGTYDGDISRSNGSGKTAILEGIAWVLFGKSRHKKKDGVVKRDCTRCDAEFDFFMQDQLYRISRMRDKSTGDTDVLLSIWDGEAFQNISCDTNTATDKKILDLIGVSYEVFINSVYFKQGDISIFADSTPSKRKDILKSLLRMEKWDLFQKKARDKVKELDVQIDEKSRNIQSLEIISGDLVICRDQLANLKNSIKEKNNEYNELSEALIAEKISYQAAYDPENVRKLVDLKKELVYTKKRLAEIEKRKEDNDKLIQQNNDQIASLRQKISVFRGKISAAKQINLESLRSRLMQGKMKVKISAEQIKELSVEVDFGDECDKCNRPLSKDDIDKIKQNRAIELTNAREKHKNIKNKVSAAEVKFKEKEEIVLQGNKSEILKSKAESKVVILKDAINSMMSENESLSNEQSKLNRIEIEKNIETLSARIGNDEENAKGNILDMENRLLALKKKCDLLNIEYGAKVRKKDELVESEKKQTKLQSEIKALKNEYAVYDKLRVYFGKDGIQAVIIENVIGELENYTNSMLEKICNESTSVAIKTQKQSDSGSWSETFDIEVKSGNSTDDFETYSGGEKFRVSLALRLALSNILSNKMGGSIKLLMLDEVTSNLDRNGLNMFMEIVKRLSDDIKVLIITHDESIKERFEDVIMIEKGPNGSTATFA